jgi:hypothetical protein
LKKMKSSTDISWNEKGELKYKGETEVYVSWDCNHSLTSFSV